MGNPHSHIGGLRRTGKTAFSLRQLTLSTYELHADNLPEYETQEARLSLFSRGNYLKRKKQLSKALLAADFTITDRRYIGHEDDTGYHHYAIDVAKLFRLEE